jgi:hypothetical protein
MSGTEFSIAALAASFGAFTGAVGIALLSWSSVSDALGRLRREIDDLKHGKGDLAKVESALRDLMISVGKLRAALAKLKGLLRIR